MFYYPVIVLISVGASFFSGLLGIGGGIILIPSYLYLLPMLGFDSFSVNIITGIAATQSLSGGFFAFKNHSKFQAINKKIVYRIALFALPGALAGTVLSKFMSGKQLLLVYLIILLLAGLSVLMPESQEKGENSPCENKNSILTNIIVFASTAISSAMGFGGAVNFMPILNYCYKLPIKSTISNVTFLVFITTIVTFLGKLFLGLVPFKLILLIFLGSALGAKIGTNISRKLTPAILKIILFFVIVIVFVRILLTYLS